MPRAGDPPTGSTLITSAPISASIWPHSSPRSVVRSSTRYGLSIDMKLQRDARFLALSVGQASTGNAMSSGAEIAADERGVVESHQTRATAWDRDLASAFP